MIEFKHIEIKYGDFVAIRDLNLTIGDGEFFTFLGPSGCGKTTTLRALVGFLEPSAGQILIDGKDVTHTPVEKRNIGMVFQSYALFPTMTVYENLAFGLKVTKLSAAEIDKKATFQSGCQAESGASGRTEKAAEESGNHDPVRYPRSGGGPYLIRPDRCI